MKRIIEYPIKNFYVGEIYLYTIFGNFLEGNTVQEGIDRIENFSNSGAINFQQDMISKHIDWENKREYTGFLTIFYKQDNKYICLHDGKTYELKGPNIIENLVSLSDLLPKIDSKILSRISMYQALEIFDILFKEDEHLYTESKTPISDFIVGDIALEERTPIEMTDKRCQYINLPHHLMLEKSELSIYSYSKDNYVNTVYRCLFLKDGVDLYNINNHQFYNPNEEPINSIVSFKDYVTDFDIELPSKSISIPKALKLFKKTI